MESKNLFDERDTTIGMINQGGSEVDEGRISTWNHNSVLLGAKGVRYGESHSYVSGVAHPSLDGGYIDSNDLLAELVQEGAYLPGVPLTMLAYVVEELESLPEFNSSLPWVAVTHQSAGMGCHQRRVIGVPVTLHEAGVELAVKLGGFADVAWNDGHSCVGIGGVMLSELEGYHRLLSSVGLSAEHTWEWLEEGCSPVDATDTNLEALGSLPGFSGEIHTLIEDSSSWGGLRLFAKDSRWSVLVLGENCD